MLREWLTRVLFKEDKNNWPGIVCVFLVLISPVILLALFTYRQVHGDLTSLAMTQRQTVAFLAAATLKQKLDRLVDLGVSLASPIRFRRLVQAGDWKEAAAMLQAAPNDFQFVDSIYLTDLDGLRMAGTPKLTTTGKHTSAPQAWYGQVKENWEPYVSDAFRKRSKPYDNLVVVAIPIRGERQKILGILVLQVKLAAFFQWTQEIDAGSRGSLYFFDRLGRLVAHPQVVPRPDLGDYSGLPAVKNVLRGHRGIEVISNPFNGVESVLAFEPVPGYGWGVLSAEPAPTAFTARSSALRKLMVVYSLILLLGSSLSILILCTLAERRRTEEALRKSEERRRSIIETAGDSFIAMDQEGKIIDWNHQAELTFGWSGDEALGRLLAEKILPVERRDSHKNGLARFMATGEWSILNKRIEITALHRSGHTFPVELMVWPLKARQSITFNAFCRDITEHKRAEETRSTLVSIVESSDDAIVGLTLEGLILSWNQGAERIYGYSAAEAIGRSKSMLVPPDRPEELTGILQRLRRGERVEHYRTELIRKDGGRIHVSLTVSPIVDSNGLVVGASTIARDITELRRSEQAIVKLTTELSQRALALEAANKELESFSYSVSHDLRAPLRAINGFAEALLEDCASNLDDQGKNYLRRVCAASKHMGELIDDLLSLSRVTRAELRRETVDLSALASSIAAELKQTDPQRAVNFTISSGLLAEGDAGLLRVALQNLLENAWKFTAMQPQAKIEFGLAKQNGKAGYFVRDNGAGFDMDYADKLFGPFQRLHSTTEFEGTGIGLATVQRIIRRHGGRVWAEGELNRGATFYFSLP
jgi:PAS domain S-box-containing protein